MLKRISSEFMFVIEVEERRNFFLMILASVIWTLQSIFFSNHKFSCILVIVDDFFSCSLIIMSMFLIDFFTIPTMMRFFVHVLSPTIHIDINIFQKFYFFLLSQRSLFVHCLKENNK